MRVEVKETERIVFFSSSFYIILIIQTVALIVLEQRKWSDFLP